MIHSIYFVMRHNSLVNQSWPGQLKDKYLSKTIWKVTKLSSYLQKHKLADVSQFGVDLETSIRC